MVRINPRELHIKDPHFYDEIYAPSSRGREKDPKFVVVFGFSTSVIATVGHDHHRLRRTLLNNFFSKKSVVDLAPMMHEKESKLMRRIESAHQHDAVVHIDDAFAALTADLISEYSWGVSTGFLDDDDFKNDIRQALNEISELVHYNRFFPILGTIMRELPRFLLARIRPGAKAVLDMQDVVTKQADRTVSKAGTESPTQTIFDALRDPSVPLAERSSRRLEDEGLIMVVAGTETTARTLTVATFHLYQDNNPFLQKLREELRTVMPMPTSQVSWPQLEQLPYLVGDHIHKYLTLIVLITIGIYIEWSCDGSHSTFIWPNISIHEGCTYGSHKISGSCDSPWSMSHMNSQRYIPVTDYNVASSHQ